MFEPGDPAPRAFDWGPRKWATEKAYDKDLAKLLGELACGRDVAEAQTRGLARRALQPVRWPRGAPDRLWPRLFAARVIGPTARRRRGCPATCATGWKSSQQGAMQLPHRRRHLSPILSND
jgi:hypothetical protein